jgi:hypothetical protein
MADKTGAGLFYLRKLVAKWLQHAFSNAFLIPFAGYRKTKEFWGPKDGRLPLASTEYKRSSYRARELTILGHGPKPTAPGGESHVLVPVSMDLLRLYFALLCLLTMLFA